MSVPRRHGQLVFEFESSALPRLDELEAGPNAELFERISRASTGLGGNLVLSGPAGSGKTQLLLAACGEAERAGASVVYAPLLALGEQATAVLPGLVDRRLVCLDDVDRVVHIDACRRALFNLWNAADEVGTALLMSSRASVFTLETGLDDLDSRLRAALSLRLAPLDDTSRERAMALMAKRRGIGLPVEVMRYLLARLPRDLHSLADAVAALDRLSLAQHRAVTVPLARDWLNSRSPTMEALP